MKNRAKIKKLTRKKAENSYLFHFFLQDTDNLYATFRGCYFRKLGTIVRNKIDKLWLLTNLHRNINVNVSRWNYFAGGKIK